MSANRSRGVVVNPSFRRSVSFCMPGKQNGGKCPGGPIAAERFFKTSANRGSVTVTHLGIEIGQ